MDKAYLHWRQNDPRFNQTEAWPRSLFPKAEYTFFRDAGCLVVALAVMLRYYDIEQTADENLFNPWTLNKELINSGAFDSAADLELRFISRLYPLEYLGSADYSEDTLRHIMERGWPCLITVPGKNADRHFTTFLSMQPDVTVFDPICGERKCGTYDRLFDIRVFRKQEIHAMSSSDCYPFLQMP